MRDAIFRDGFPIRGQKFALPPETISLDPKTKREVTICNLFINHKLSITDILRVLDEDYRHIVNVLLNSGKVDERRQDSQVPPEGIDRRRSWD
jgi:hypothetical protein